MALSFCVLGSGSGGNCTLVLCTNGDQRRCFLIDCGLSPRQVNKRLESLPELGLTVADITAIVITHFDSDHFYSGWIKPIEKLDIRVHMHKRHRNAAWRTGLTARHAFHFEDEFMLDGGTLVRAALLAHDDLGSVGYVVQHDETRLGFATDLGHVPRQLFDLFTADGGIDALALESNYDRQMQVKSGRPAFLKQRIMGGHGHLSNVQSLEAINAIAANAELSHIALLHLSRQCNCPKLLHRMYVQAAPHLVERVTITNQFQCTPLLTVHKAARPASSSAAALREKAAAFASRHSQLPLFAA